MSYEPRPGTVAFMALAYLETLPPGSEVMTSKLAEAIGQPSNNVTPCLEAARLAGRLFRRQRDDHVRSPYWWSLTDRSAQPKPPAPRVEPVFMANGTACIPEAPGSQQVLKAKAARPDATDCDAPAIPSPRGGARGAVQPAAAGHAGMRIALWSDGALQIERQHSGGAAELMLLSAEETRQLVAYLDRLAS